MVLYVRIFYCRINCEHLRSSFLAGEVTSYGTELRVYLFRDGESKQRNFQLAISRERPGFKAESKALLDEGLSDVHQTTIPGPISSS